MPSRGRRPPRPVPESDEGGRGEAEVAGPELPELAAGSPVPPAVPAALDDGAQDARRGARVADVPAHRPAQHPCRAGRIRRHDRWLDAAHRRASAARPRSERLAQPGRVALTRRPARGSGAPRSRRDRGPSISPRTSTSVAAGRTARNRMAVCLRTAGMSASCTMYIRVRTTSASSKPASARACSIVPNAARAWAPTSPGWRARPSGPASVVPETQHASPTTTARL